MCIYSYNQIMSDVNIVMLPISITFTDCIMDVEIYYQQ